ncbi:MAG: InlB B-repeat-containing protein [Anaeroplasmataceae bacterium]|nr:InlB B-repeat-containing protein [Anaeroplasmataceae bacterium]
MKKFFAAIAFIFCLILVSCKTEKEPVYTITYHDEGTITEIQYNPNAVIPNKDILGSTKEGYELTAWYFDTQHKEIVTFPYTVTEDKDFYAEWIKIHSIYLMYGASTLKTEKIKDGQIFNDPGNPQVTGAGTFKGWSSDKDSYVPFDFTAPIHEDVNLYAFFEDTTPATITISFMDGDTLVATNEIQENTTVSKITAPSKDGYTFKGWSSDKDNYTEFDFNTVLNVDTKLYAFYDPVVESITVTFVDDEKTLHTATINKGSTVSSFTAPSKVGYTFKGWSSDKNKYTEFDFSTVLNVDTTLYAFYDPVVEYVKVEFIADDKTLHTATIVKGTTASSFTAPSKVGYTFKGWSSDKNTYTEFDFSKTLSSDTTLYAFYEINKITITYKMDNEVYTTQSIDYNTKPEAPKAPVKIGYRFLFWYTDNDDSKEYKFDTKLIDNLTLYAKFEEVETYTLTLIIDGVTSKILVNAHSTIADAILPSKEGHTLIGWYLDAAYQNKFDDATEFEGEHTLYGYYQINTYTITFKNDDSIVETKTATYNTTVSVPTSDPVKTGYTFKGWSIDETTYTPFTSSTKITDDITVYAFFDINTYTVTFKNGSVTVSTKTVDYNTTVELPAGPSKTGYTFKGWSTNETTYTQFNASTKITTNTTLYAFFDINTYTVTFKNGSVTVSTKTVDYNTTVDLPSSPSKTGYTFKGWSTKENSFTEFNVNTKITADTTLYAFFDINTYTVTFKNGSVTVSTKTVDYNATIDLPAGPSKTGYTFKGWSTNETTYTQFNASTKITTNTTLYAFFDINTYTVTFKNGSVTYSTKTVDYNTTVELPASPSKTGHTFKGWSTNETTYAEFNASTKITTNTTLYAFFDINTFTVTFKDGNTTLDTQTIDYNSTAALPANPSKTGYTFKGWSTQEASFVEFNANTKITSNLTIYAYFVEVFTVTFNVDGTKTTTQVESGNKVTEPATPTKSGYAFTGWYLNNSKFNFNTPITDSIELVAHFEEAQIEITSYNGYNEGLYFEATPVAGASLSDYSVQYKLASDSTSSWKTVDQQLIREQNSKIRCDIIGLPAGSYQVKIAAAGKSITISCEVSEDDRSGYAHFGNTTGVGAYNNNGTLKSNAVVVYVTDATKNTVKATIGGKEYTGLVNIIKACTKSSYALDIRILGEIQTTQWNFKEHGEGNTAERQTNLENTFNYVNNKTGWDEGSSTNYSKLNAEEIISKGINSMSADEAKGITKLNGLTNQVLRNKKPDSKTNAYEYDSYYNMLDVSGAYNITIEGIGTDAAIFQWGFAFKKCNSIEIKNIRFYNYTEDAVGFEGASNTDTNYGNYWVHNCTFDIGVNNWDVCYENDKKDGDGSSDVKYCHNVTISYVQYNKTHKTNLIGSSDSALQYNITLHHNYYNNCGSRLPLVRQTNIHMYNNYYYKSTSYSNSIRAHCYALVENCYYEAGQNPYETQSNGAIKAYNNVYDSVKLTSSTYKSGNTVTSRTASVTNTCKPDGSTDYSDFDMNSTLFYYDSVNQVSKVKNMLNPNDVPEHCKTYSGVLKANAKGFDTGASTPINPDPIPSETWTNQLNETFSSSSTITQREYSTTPPTAAGIYYSYDGGTTGSSTNNNVSIKNNELLITDNGDATTYGYYIFNQKYNTGKVKISIDFKPQTSNSKWAMIHFLDGSSNLRICTDASKYLSYSIDGGSNTPTICGSEMKANTVYTIILTIDYDKNTATIQIGSDTVTFAYSKTISGIMFQTAGSNARTFSVDNIKIDTTN